MPVTDHYAIPKPDRTATVAEEFDRLGVSWDTADAVLKQLADAIATRAAATHGHPIAEIAGLGEALSAMMPADRTFALGDISDVIGAADAAAGYVLAKSALGFGFSSPASLLGKHQHEVADIPGLAAALEALRGSAPASLDTLAKLAAAIGGDPDFAGSITSLLADADRLSSGTVDAERLPERLRAAGVATLGEATAGTDNTKIMTPLATARAIAAQGGGGPPNMVTITASGTYAKPEGLKWIEVIVIGGGGGRASQGGDPAGSGSSGKVTTAYLAAADLATVTTVVVGAGGGIAGGTGSGSTGGTSSFGSLTAAGGAGGGQDRTAGVGGEGYMGYGAGGAIWTGGGAGAVIIKEFF